MHKSFIDKNNVHRRNFLITSGIATTTLLTACKQPSTVTKPIRWKMATTWPALLPGLSEAATSLANTITRASGGRLIIDITHAGEPITAFSVFDAVSKGTVEMGHSAAYYWHQKIPAASFFCSMPFGFNAQEMNAWLYHGGGLDLWHEIYAPFHVLAFPAGNTGMQMAGWFNREITSLGDITGLKMRIPGIGGEIMAHLGASPINIPATEIYTALQSGTIDAAEWMSPYNDLALALFRVAKYCYYPGWQEPGTSLECLINKTAFNQLPEDLQFLVRQCCQAANQDVLAYFTMKNQQALAILRDQHHVEFRRLPESVLKALQEASQIIIEAHAHQNIMSQKVYSSVKKFRQQIRPWINYTDIPFYQARR